MQADYYPNGCGTILDIMHAKMLRLRSVMEAMQNNPDYEPNFESLEDSAIDLINYSSFFVAYGRGKIPGQTMHKDWLNKLVSPEDVLKSLIKEDQKDGIAGCKGRATNAPINNFEPQKRDSRYDVNVTNSNAYLNEMDKQPYPPYEGAVASVPEAFDLQGTLSVPKVSGHGSYDGDGVTDE